MVFLLIQDFVSLPCLGTLVVALWEGFAVWDSGITPQDHTEDGVVRVCVLHECASLPWIIYVICISTSSFLLLFDLWFNLRGLRHMGPTGQI